MKLSKKMKKKVKKNLLKVLVAIATITSTMAAAKSMGLTTGKFSISSALKKYGDSSVSLKTSTISADSLTLTETVENTMIAAGNTFGVILKADGTVWTWGNNTYGQLGNGEVKNSSTSKLTRVLGVNGEGYLSDIKQISAGAYGVIALTNDGKVVGWGRNEYGQLANTKTANSAVPVYIQKQVKVTDEAGTVTTEYHDLDNIKQISRGSSHALALTNDGKVWAWGLNNYGQLGINVGHTTASNANYKRTYAVQVQKQIAITLEDGTEGTTLVDLDNIAQVSGGTDFSTALTNDGTVWAWGLGKSGQIGNAAASTVYIPKQVSNLTDVKKIDAG